MQGRRKSDVKYLSFTVKKPEDDMGYGCVVGEPLCASTFHLLARGDKQYLQVGMVDRERRAEKTLDNGHHGLCHVFLQGRISVVTICSGIANLKCKKQG